MAEECDVYVVGVVVEEFIDDDTYRDRLERLILEGGATLSFMGWFSSEGWRIEEE